MKYLCHDGNEVSIRPHDSSSEVDIKELEAKGCHILSEVKWAVKEGPTSKVKNLSWRRY